MSKLTGSPVHYVLLYTFFGDLQTYTFLESVEYRQSENQCLQISEACMAAILDF